MFARRYVPVHCPLWALTEDVVIADEDSGCLTVKTPARKVRIDDTSDLVRQSLYRMTLGPVALENVSGLADAYARWRSGASGDCEAWHRLRRVLDELSGNVIASLALGGGHPLLSAVPRRPVERFAFPHMSERAAARRARHSSLNANRSCATVTAYSASYAVELSPPATTVAHALGTGDDTPISKIAADTQLSTPIVADIVAYLAAAGVAIIDQ